MTDLRPEALTWTALLAKWVEFAQASLALPEDGDGPRWRESVAAIINLQAVTLALAELGEIAEADRPLARDRATLLVAESVRQIQAAWRGAPMPEELLEMGDDARDALEMSAYAGATELIWPGPDTMIMPDVSPPPVRGSFAIMQPGTIVMPGEPVAWWASNDGVTVRGCEARPVSPPRQVYRRVDRDGRILEDLIAPISSPMPAGLPLLVPLVDDGRPAGTFTLDAAAWLERQRSGMTGETIPVVEVASELSESG
ncbi:MAG: hypothetical protein ACYTGG_01495 [Planctomycetota bacterium]